MRIRRAQESEASVLSAIALESKASWSYSTSQLAIWRKELTIQASDITRYHTFVAESETASKPVGFFVLQPFPQTWVLEHFWVAPANIGRGVGRAMLARARSEAASGGAVALSIDADPNAEPFYLACGACRVASIKAPIEGDPDRERPQLLLSTAQPDPHQSSA